MIGNYDFRVMPDRGDVSIAVLEMAPRSFPDHSARARVEWSKTEEHRTHASYVSTKRCATLFLRAMRETLWTNTFLILPSRASCSARRRLSRS
jgi:hypothetical protein